MATDGLDTNTRLNLIVKGILHSFYLVLIFPFSIPIYLKCPNLIVIDWVLFYYYRVVYLPAKHQFEAAKSGRKIGELTWGLTPYFTLEKVLRYVPIRKSTVFYDLGCGPGGLVLYMARRYQIRAVGLDVIETYVRVANWIAKRFKITRARFGCKDFLEANLDYADIIFVAGTCLSEGTWEALEGKLEALRKGTWVITVSEPLKSTHFKKVKQVTGLFYWGTGTLYLFKKISE